MILLSRIKQIALILSQFRSSLDKLKYNTCTNEGLNSRELEILSKSEMFPQLMARLLLTRSMIKGHLGLKTHQIDFMCI